MGTRKFWKNPESREKQSKKLSQATKKSWENPEIRAKTVASMKETNSKPEMRAANAVRTRQLWNNPGFRKIMADPNFLKKRGQATAESNRQRVWTPEATAKRVEKFKKFWDDKRGGPKPPPPGYAKGERNAKATLTEDIVRQIRALEGTLKRPAVAKMFGLNVWHVRDIQKRRCWKHVE